MANVLRYQDMYPTEQLQYTQLLSAGASGARHTPALPPSRTLWSLIQSVYCYGKRLFSQSSPAPEAQTAWTALEQFIRTQAAQHGCDTFARDSFPDFPDAAEPFATVDAAKPDYPQALHDIIAAFHNADPAQHLAMLVAYAERLPALPEELSMARDTMEQVDECMTPVFLSAQLHDGRVHYCIDAPQDAPTMRGFAGLLYVGLNGATPAAIAAVPPDLCQQLGLQKALGALRSRGLVALLRRMQRNAVDLARTT